MGNVTIENDITYQFIQMIGWDYNFWSIIFADIILIIISFVIIFFLGFIYMLLDFYVK